MAEIEQASLRSEQLSDKSSSPPHLPDDLSLDEHTAYQLLVREDKGGRSSSDSQSSEEAGGRGGVPEVEAHQTQTQAQVGLEPPYTSLSSGGGEEEEEGTALMELEVQADQHHHHESPVQWAKY
ncbi:hypothetical protein N1851_014138 [Merluccius polli]|uniref:Uncharacterized protein n=1 Tax=Merluccius polli TaxID=89951 RepID=A0AA47MUS3_MERPO|nr:hypothetical protein N1851_014138 [Merluccius polli]